MMSESIGGFEPKKIVITAAVIAAIATTVVGAAILMGGSGGGSENTQKDNIVGEWHFAMDTGEVSSLYPLQGVPTLVAVDSEGYIAYLRSGMHWSDDLLNIIDYASKGAGPLFDIETDELENGLNQGEVPRWLENELESNGLSIPDGTMLVSVENKWKINVSSSTFVLSNDNGGLGVYWEAPDFTLTTFDNQPFTLFEHRGEVVLLDLMAVGCSPCKQQMPELKELDLERGENVTILSVDVYPNETRSDVKGTYGEYILGLQD